MCQSPLHLYNSFSKCVHIHNLTLLQQVWSEVGRTHSPEEGPEVQTADSQKVVQKTPFPSTGALFSFPCAKAWHPLGGMKAAYLVPYRVISVQRKQPDAQWPLLCETAKTLREAPFLVLLPLYLGQSQMGMCFKIQTP